MPIFLRYLMNLAPANPIAVRLVQNGSRRSRHMLIRSAYLALLVLVMLWALLAQTGGGGAVSFRRLAEAGAGTFTSVAYLQIFLICVLSPVFMAGAIAQEASPRTWEVLLTTPLSRVQIVLGNLLGRLFFVLALLFASLPLFALTQYFGGVPGRSIFASYLVAAAAALLVGAIAIALAVSRVAGRRAVFTFYVAVVTYLGLSWGLDSWLRLRGMGVGPAGQGVTWITGLNPFLALDALLNPTTYPSADTGTRAGPAAFMLERPVRAWILLSTGLSLLLVAASTLTVRTGGLARRSEGRRIPWYRKMLGLSGTAADGEGITFRPPRHVWHNPIAWREAAARNATLGRIVSRWAFIVLGVALAVVLILAYDTSAIAAQDYRLALLVVVLVELAVTTLVAINMSATAISREREDGTLDLLLTTPITPAEYMGGKMRGLVAYLIPMMAVPVATMLLAGLHALVGGFNAPNNAQVPAGPALQGVMLPVVLPEAGVVLALSAAPFMALCVMIGLHWSLKSKGAIASVVGAVLVAAVIAAVVGGCGFNAGRSIPAVGPALLGLSPFASTMALVEPVEAMYDTVVQSGGSSSLLVARSALLIGAAVSAGIHVVAVWALHSQMVRRFDMTVRKLAGTN